MRKIIYGFCFLLVSCSTAEPLATSATTIPIDKRFEAEKNPDGTITIKKFETAVDRTKKETEVVVSEEKLKIEELEYQRALIQQDLSNLAKQTKFLKEKLDEMVQKIKLATALK